MDIVLKHILIFLSNEYFLSFLYDISMCFFLFFSHLNRPLSDLIHFHIYKQEKVRGFLLCSKVVLCFSVFCQKKKGKKRERHNHKHCSDVIKWSEKMPWLSLVLSVLNGVILQPSAFIVLCPSKDQDILSSGSSLFPFPLSFFFFFSFV